MRFAISGGEGLIGSSLKKRLLERGDECNLEIDIRKGSNILNINSFGINMKTQPIDIFFHLSAYCKINECIKNPELANENNSNGTFQALEFCRKNNIKKFVYMSSSRILSPEKNPYTASKIYGEELCKGYNNSFNLEYLIIRPSTVYGNHHDLTTRLITNWTINALTGKDLVIYGDKNKTLDFTHVDDFVDGIEILLNNWGKAKNKSFDICGDDCRKLSDVAKYIFHKEPIYKEPEVAQPQQVKIDITKMRELGYSPKIKLEQGVERLIKFYETEGKEWLN